MKKHARKQAAAPSKGVRTLFEWLEEIAVALTLVILILTFAFRVVTVSGDSMRPNYVDGERLIIANHGSKIEQGSVVVLTNVLDAPIIKRVIATEGQTVDIDFDQGIVYVDGVALEEDYINNLTTNSGGVYFPLVVEEGCVFALGDNRSVSKDSRYPDIGQIDTREILGKAIFLMVPGTNTITNPQPRDFTRIGVIE